MRPLLFPSIVLELIHQQSQRYLQEPSKTLPIENRISKLTIQISEKNQSQKNSNLEYSSGSSRERSISKAVGRC